MLQLIDISFFNFDKGHIIMHSLIFQEEIILETLGLAHQYGFVDLEASISDYLRQILQIRNVCMIYDAARLYQLQFLTRVCSSFMDKNAQEIIHHESFLQLSPVSILSLILFIGSYKILIFTCFLMVV